MADLNVKYRRFCALARERELAGDNIEAENMWQHAEHYLRAQADSAN